MITRRTFLGLTAAGLVGAYTDAWPLPPLVPRVEALLPAGFGRQGINVYDLFIDGIDGDDPVQLTVSRLPARTPLLKFGIAAHGYLRWVAPLWSGLIIRPGETLEISPGGPVWQLCGQDCATGRLVAWTKDHPPVWLDRL